MTKKFRVVLVGFGPMGQRVAKLLLKRNNIALIGVVDIDPDLIGKEIEAILKLKQDPKLTIKDNLSVLLEKRIDVVKIATTSFFEKIVPMIKEVAKKGVNIISLCEQLSYPWEFHAKLAREIDKIAKENNITVVGSGINPGYLMDLLPIVLTAPCETVEKIHVTRMMNSNKRRIPFQKKIGTGLTLEEFKQKITNKEITGHVGLEESLHMIVAALGLDIDSIEELPPKAMFSEEEFESPMGMIQKGQVCGLHSRGVAKKKDTEIIILDFYAYAGDHDEYDSVIIEGIPGIHQKIIGGIHGDIGTAAMIVNLIPKVIEANSGLLTMKDLPAPCNTAHIWKK
ncbi:MAG: dihydrodipicolinate reductase [Asgard group archaeon]|nr:dihydrodipicolinate reductase [Asgard group archaeon]